MTGSPPGPIPPEAMRGQSDWDDEDLLTVVEASDRLAEEIAATRQRIRRVEEVLGEDGSPAIDAGHVAGLAAERKRLDELVRAAERIKAAQADAPSANVQPVRKERPNLALSARSADLSRSIEAVVFDMGGVLTVDPFEACRDYADELCVPTDTFVDQLRGQRFAAVETGESSVRDFLKFACRDVADRLGVPVDIRRLADCLAAGQRVRPEMVVLIEDLVGAGAKVGVLTNNAKEARSWWTSGVLPLESFTAVVDSSEVGLRKPDPAIFAMTADRMGCPTARLLYFDDMQENVVGAAAAGLVARAFTDPAACRRECAERGLL